MAEVLNLVSRLRLDSKSFDSNLRKTENSLLKFSAGIVAVTAGIGATVKASAELIDTNTKLARSVGLTQKEFAGISLASDQAGLSIEQTRMFMSQLAGPTDRQRKLLDDLGVSLVDSSGNAVSTSGRLSQLADSIQMIEDPTVRVQKAVELLGSRGATALNLFAGGSKGLADYANEADKLGLTLSQVQAEAVEEFNNQIGKVGSAVQGVGIQFTATVTQFILSSGVLVTLKDTISEVTNFWKGLDDATKDIVLSVGTGIVAFGTLIPVIIGARRAFTALSVAITANPIGIIIAGIATAVIVLTTTFLKFRDQIQPVFGPLIDNFSKLGDLITPIIDKFKNLFSGTEELGEGFKESGEEVSVLGTIVKVIFSGISTIIGLAINFVRAYIIIWRTVAFTVLDVGKSVRSALSGDFTGALNIATGAVDRIKTSFSEVRKIGIDSVNQVTKAFTEFTPVINTNKIRLDSFNKSQEQAGNQATDTAKKICKSLMDTRKKLSEADKARAESVKKIKQFASDLTSLGNIVSDIGGIATQAFTDQLKETEEYYASQIVQAETYFDSQVSMIESNYDAQIGIIKAREDEILETLDSAKNDRLLSLDDEYKKRREMEEVQFQSFLESETRRLEAEQEILLQETTNADENRLVEITTQQEFDLIIEGLRKNHEENLNNLQKEALSNRMIEENEFNSQIMKVTSEASTQRENVEESKNNRIEELDSSRALEIEKIEREQAKATYDIQRKNFEATRALDITQTIISGLVGSAQAFARAFTVTEPISAAIIGGIAGVAILASTGAAVASIAQKKPPPPPTFQDGGVIGGTQTHSRGGINANIESGEAIVDRTRTNRLFDFLDNETSGRNITINIEEGAIVTQNIQEDVEVIAGMLADRIREEGL